MFSLWLLLGKKVVCSELSPYEDKMLLTAIRMNITIVYCLEDTGMIE